MKRDSNLQLHVIEAELKGVLIVHPPTRHDDFRGNYVETYNRKLYSEAGITDDFIQDDFSTSRKHVLRGIHGDNETVKLVSCVFGAIYLVVVNNDPQSSQYRKWQSFHLSDTDNLQVYVPAKFGNSYLVMSDQAIFHYKQTTHYNRESQFTIKWNDPEFGIWWPVRDPILSQRDFS